MEGLLKLATSLAGLFAGSPDADEPWAHDESSRGALRYPVRGLHGQALPLDGDQQKRYKKTLEVNPEAAVLWVCMLQV